MGQALHFLRGRGGEAPARGLRLDAYRSSPLRPEAIRLAIAHHVKELIHAINDLHRQPQPESANSSSGVPLLNGSLRYEGRH
jgi:hypothetical protein